MKENLSKKKLEFWPDPKFRKMSQIGQGSPPRHPKHPKKNWAQKGLGPILGPILGPRVPFESCNIVSAYGIVYTKVGLEAQGSTVSARILPRGPP